jgi:predicted nucleic acid-binding protein
MTVFIDTSAFYAVVDRSDQNHARARAVWTEINQAGAVLLTTNYVVLEISVLLQSRLGLPALRAFQEDVIPVLQIVWITEPRHKAGLEAVLAASRRKLSIVDCVSFQTMREYAIRRAFCFDLHFREQGFEILP